MNYPEKSLLTIFILLLAVPLATSHGVHLQEVDEKNLQKVKEEFNSYGEVPEFLEGLAGNQTVELHINHDGTQETVGVKTSGSKISKVSESPYNSTTLEVWTNTTQIDHLLNSDDPVSKLNSYMKEDKIRYKAERPVDKLKFFTAEKLLGLSELL